MVNKKAYELIKKELTSFILKYFVAKVFFNPFLKDNFAVNLNRWGTLFHKSMPVVMVRCLDVWVLKYQYSIVYSGN